MPFSRLIRSTLALGLLAVNGCVAAVPVQPAASGQAFYGQQCFAGFYVCPAQSAPSGTPCSCPGIGAPSYGVIR